MAKGRLRAGVRPMWGATEVGVDVSTVTPTPGWVIIEEDYAMETSPSGYFLVSSYKTNTVFGEIIAINIADSMKSQILPGDRIVYREFAGGRWSFQGRKLLITPLEAILAWDERGN